MGRIQLKRLFHYLFKCPTFWHHSIWYTCPDCGKRYPCYWDGSDCSCGTIHICMKCAVNHAEHGTTLTLHDVPQEEK